MPDSQLTIPTLEPRRARLRIWHALVAGLPVLFAFALLSVSPVRNPARFVPNDRRVLESYLQLPLSIVANAGQFPAHVLYRAVTQGYSANFSRQGVDIELADRVRIAAIRLSLPGSNPNPTLIAQDPLPGVLNYFHGSDSKRWLTRVSHYRRLLYKSVYPGIDLVFYGRSGRLEFDFVVAPGAAPSAIALSLEAAGHPRIDDRGDIVLPTPAGELRQHRPVAYQDTPRGRRWLDARYVAASGTSFGITAPDYDPALPLVLDPVLSFAACLGGNDTAKVAIDSQGFAYIAGRIGSASVSPQLRITASEASGLSELFVAKIDPAGPRLVFATFLGGSGDDGPSGLAVDPDGNIVLTGSTDSPDWPTVNPAQKEMGGGGSVFFISHDGGATFLSKSKGLPLSHVAQIAQNRSMLWAAGWGGVYKSADNGENWTAANAGIAAVRGCTLVAHPTDSSTLWLATETDGTFRTTDGGATWTRVQQYASCGLAYDARTSTLYSGAPGGIKTSADNGTRWTAVSSGLTEEDGLPVNFSRILVHPLVSTTLYGVTTYALYKSTDGGASWTRLPLKLEGYATFGPFAMDPKQPDVLYVQTQARVLRSSDGGLTWKQLMEEGSYLPGVTSLAVSPADPQTLFATSWNGGFYTSRDGGATWTPSTKSLPGYPLYALATGSDDPAIVYAGAAALPDAFLAKLDPQGQSLLFSTFIGGAGTDNARALTLDSSGHAYVAGSSDSGSSLPVKPENSLLPTGPPEDRDLFVAQVNLADGNMVYCVRIGASGSDEARAIAVAPDSSVYVAGVTSSYDFPLRGELLRFRSNSGGATFLLRLAPDASTLLFSSRIGGSGYDEASAMAIDAEGYIYLAGTTNSPDFPLIGPLGRRPAGKNDAFLMKLAPSATHFLYSLVTGGSDDDNVHALALGPAGNAFVAGETRSTDFPLVEAVRTVRGDYSDAFVVEVDRSGSAVSFSSYLGGSFASVSALATDASGGVHLAGLAGLGSGLVSGSCLDSSFRPSGGTSSSATLFHARIEIPPRPASSSLLVVTSAASQRIAAAAPESLVSLYGERLSAETASAESGAALTELGGVAVNVTDSTGVSRTAGLIMVSPNLVKAVIPAGTALGTATVSLRNAAGETFSGPVAIEQVAPALFSAGGNGEGAASGLVVYKDSLSAATLEDPLALFDDSTNAFAPLPVDVSFSAPGFKLILYATGVRHRSSLSAVQLKVADKLLTPTSAGARAGVPGVDQVEFALEPGFFDGMYDTEVSLSLVAAGKESNAVGIGIYRGYEDFRPILFRATPSAFRAGQSTKEFALYGRFPKETQSIEIVPPDGLTVGVPQYSQSRLVASFTVVPTAVLGQRQLTVITAAGRSNTIPLEIRTRGSAPHVSDLRIDTVRRDETTGWAKLAGSFKFTDPDADIVAAYPWEETMNASLSFSAPYTVSTFPSPVSGVCLVRGVESFLNQPGRTSGTVNFSLSFHANVWLTSGQAEVTFVLRDSAGNSSNQLKFKTTSWNCE